MRCSFRASVGIASTPAATAPTCTPSSPRRQSAWRLPIQFEGEKNLPEIYAEPLPVVVEVLRSTTTWDAVLANLPDCELSIWCNKKPRDCNPWASNWFCELMAWLKLPST